MTSPYAVTVETMKRDGFSDQEIQDWSNYLADHNEDDRDNGELDKLSDSQVELWYENWEGEGRPHTSARQDAALAYMSQFPEWTGPERMQSGHRRWQWVNPVDGRVHHVTCGAGTHGGDASVEDARMLKSRVRACQGGVCTCRSQPTEQQQPQQVQQAPTQLLPGQQVSYNGQPYWITEIDGDLAAILSDNGEEDLVPVTNLQVMGNVLDPVANSLDSAIFIHPEAPDPQVNPKLNKWVHQAVYAALEKHGYEGPQRWLKMFLTGSLCTYQYSPEADFDLNLFVDSAKFPEWSRAEMIGILTTALDGENVPGTNHPLQIFVSSKELGPKDKFKPGLRAAYDLDADKWLVPPDKNSAHDVEHEMNTSYIYALEVADKMDRLLRFEPDKAIHAYNVLHKLRKSHDSQGDFNQYNIAYKYLSNHGYFDKLRKLGVPIH